LGAAVGRAVALWLDRERLGTELRAAIGELRGSRERLLHAGDAERRRIERDLHDGAQQRLASLLLSLKLERRRLGQADSELLDVIEAGLAGALGELRDLAAGILPPLLVDRGLPAAVAELAGRSPVPVEIARMPSERLGPEVEVAAYFVISEALANVVKHAGARHVTVLVDRDDGRAVVEVTDDGVGGAVSRSGSGLRGLSDRVGALDGSLAVQSPPGGGTRLHVELPCAP
jgi:signal transduction histidine kinase